MDHIKNKITSEEKYRILVKIGLALTAERNSDKLLELIVKEARNLSNADGGTLYLLDDDKQNLNFKILQNDSMKLSVINAEDTEAHFPPIPLSLDNKPNFTNVASYVALKNEVVDIPDVYKATNFDFTGPKRYDAQSGYHSKSMLVVPLKDQNNQVLGVLQLINAMDSQSGEIITFDCAYTEVITSLASQAAMALINMNLLEELRTLLYSFMKSIATAIDEKSPFTGGHIKRVKILTMMIAKAVNDSPAEPFSNINFSEEELEEIRLAAWMHDVGKIAVPEHIIDKETKLQTIFERFEYIETRFKLISQLLENNFLRQKAELLGSGQSEHEALKNPEQKFSQQIEELNNDLMFVKTCNCGTEFMTDDKIERLEQIAAKTYSLEGRTYPYLQKDELDNLCIRKGTLCPQERMVIENHTTVTWKILSQLSFPKNIANIPEFACGHHERLDGSGYHLKLSADKISLQVRIMAIADIFEALTAKDRPYRQPMKLSKALEILDYMQKDGHIDGDILDLFITTNLYSEYAAKEMFTEQIDI